MLFHKFGEDGILALEPGFERLDLLVLGVLGEGGMAVLEELLEPGVERVGVEIVLIAQVGDGNLVDEVPRQDEDLLGAGEVTMRSGPDEPPVGLN